MHSQQEFIFDHLPVAALQLDMQGCIKAANSAARVLLGQRQQTLVGTHLVELFNDKEGKIKTLLQRMARCCVQETGTCPPFVALESQKLSAESWQEMSSTSETSLILELQLPILTQVEVVFRCVPQMGWLLVLHERTREQETLALMQRYFQIIEQTDDLIMITDCVGKIDYVNPAFERCTGLSTKEILGQTPGMLKSGKHDSRFYMRLWRTLQQGQPFRDVFINRRKDGSLYYEEKTITPLRDASGRVTHYISTGKDISKHVETQERLAYVANHDILTGLPNRTALKERLDRRIQRAQLEDKQLALLLIDLDRFKQVNDSFGHRSGDQLLQEVARRIAELGGPQQLIARQSADEFIVLLENIRTPRAAAYIAHKLIHELERPFDLEGGHAYLSASIGITLYPTDGNSASQLLHNADIAMQRAKESGGETYRFFTDDMTTQAAQRLQMESQLRQALLHKEFFLEYQPRIDLKQGKLVAVEALLRWKRADGSRVSPAEFIPLLEEMGLITSVGEWVLHTACREARYWQEIGLPKIRVAVNLSARQFHQANLYDVVQKCLFHSGLPASCLELEITEGLMIDNVQESIALLQRLNHMGVHLSIDDFGTGYSSLAYLKRFPVHTLKVDRSFVNDVTTDPHDAAIVQTVIHLAHNLNLTVTAEGIETQAQLDFVRHHGCNEGQGYFLARPMPSENLIAWYQAQSEITEETSQEPTQASAELSPPPSS
ncbi:PAS domain S-box-containing protein/diguanylate cyclase (GGDEF) domain-containing protein [Allopseudospirillum japonicum]|uniref:cyclic-guanylate-specific phosphodiesterase n=1 Tax=Allopseudospirillum japonicum TaxID=64971 RepID=A0A1H6UJM4_9GAMM|nr:bifunctional diguanylate cyclase/phosphodiesterase [Allopseudospirillum japonicum]SEI91896.1 PAS domain S-box-containing protein/diguanylate cyclase (GGDEF) domain-containing protein [Allopseudospirillum japonicum]